MPPLYNRRPLPCPRNPPCTPLAYLRLTTAAVSNRLRFVLAQSRRAPLWALCAVLQNTPLVSATAEDTISTPSREAEASRAAVRKTFKIRAGEAAVALKQFSEQSGLSVRFAPDRVAGIKTREVVGQMSTRDALNRLLAGTKLYAVRTKEPGAYAIRREGADRPNG